jgi:hypothetical protein
MPARREEGRVAERRAQDRQLQAGDLTRHLRRHLRVGQDLVEQAADDVDHHVIEAAGGRPPQFVAVGVDQVGRRRPARVVGPAAAADAAAAVAAVAAVAAARRLDMRELADQRHHLRVDLAEGGPQARVATEPA